jgi:rhodanese-related sulfurtransferase
MTESRMPAGVVSAGQEHEGIKVIGAQELRQKLVRGDHFKLVNALGNWEFEAKHIPGSLHLPTVEEAVRELSVDDEIVVYCSNPSCRASSELYKHLEERGYRNLRRFAGGIVAWEDAGYPLEGKWVG